MLYRLGRLVAAHPLLVIALWIAGAAGVTVLVDKVGADTNNTVNLPGRGARRRPTCCRPVSRRSRTARTR